MKSNVQDELVIEDEGEIEQVVVTCMCICFPSPIRFISHENPTEKKIDYKNTNLLERE